MHALTIRRFRRLRSTLGPALVGAALLGLASPSPAQPITTSALAGALGPGFVNGTGSAALFNLPTYVVVLANGDALVSDASNHVIRRVTPAGVVTTFAGSGIGGWADGPAASAKFDAPAGLALDATGALIVADTNNQVIRRVSLAGNVTTLAGMVDEAGFTDGPVSIACFFAPSAVAVRSDGSILVADTNNHVIRRLVVGSMVTTVAGQPTSAGFVDGTGTAARLAFPRGIAMGTNGNAYICDTNNSAIRELTPANLVTTIAGNGTSGLVDGFGSAARLNRPRQISAHPDGTFYVADQMNHAVRQVSAGGAVATIAGTGAAGSMNGTTATFNNPWGVAARPDGTLVVGDSSNNLVRSISNTPWTNVGSALAGAGGTPSLAGAGLLASGTLGALELGGAAPSAISLLFVGLAAGSAPFKGGTLVPFPVLVSISLITNGAGELTLPWLGWPTGVPSAVPFYFQVWIADVSGPGGATASNAVRGTTP